MFTPFHCQFYNIDSMSSMEKWDFWLGTTLDSDIMVRQWLHHSHCCIDPRWLLRLNFRFHPLLLVSISPIKIWSPLMAAWIFKVSFGWCRRRQWCDGGLQWKRRNGLRKGKKFVAGLKLLKRAWERGRKRGKIGPENYPFSIWKIFQMENEK